MSERKYRQRGYQDDYAGRGPGEQPGERSRAPRRDGAPRSVINREHRTPNMPGFHDVMRCARCRRTLRTAIGPATKCPACGSPLHCCAQCASFDGGSRFECLQPVPARIFPKDARNDCTYFSPQVTVERQTRSEVAAGPRSARQAFDDLFK